jgi:hypothetical protein
MEYMVSPSITPPSLLYLLLPMGEIVKEDGALMVREPARIGVLIILEGDVLVLTSVKPLVGDEACSPAVVVEVIRPRGDGGGEEDMGRTIFMEPPIMLRSDTSTTG